MATKTIKSALSSMLSTTHQVEGEKPIGEIPRFRTPLVPGRRKAKLEARKKIKPIADPEAGQAARRKKAAKRRQTGRVGTVLTETLG